MDFYDLNKKNIEREVKKLDTQLNKVRKKKRSIEAEKQTKKELLEIIQGLETGWMQIDPGERDPHYSFLVMKSSEWDEQDLIETCVVAKEFVDPKYLKNRGEISSSKIELSGSGYVTIPLTIPVIPLKQVIHRPCPKCGKSLPLIRYYHKLYDSAERDVWRKKYFVICCGGIQYIDLITTIKTRKKFSDIR